MSTMRVWDEQRVRELFIQAAGKNTECIDISLLINEVNRTVFEGISEEDFEKACMYAAISFIERDPAYSKVGARILLRLIAREIFKKPVEITTEIYKDLFISAIERGVEAGLLDQRMNQFDLEFLARALQPERDYLFEYMGLHILYERYLFKIDDAVVELPQIFWMRIAMGLALNETNKEEKAVEFYECFSNLWYVPSTPTLFHAGLPIAQLSSCYLSTIEDDLEHIFKCVGDSAQLAKWAGGIGTDWSNIRATGSYIKSIKATSQGIVPFLKIYNDLVVAISKTGIRRGGICVYLEVWHFDIEDFLDLRRNTGDDRRRAHDMNTAVWVPDLFMKRLIADGDWTLFSPNEVPDLHNLYGVAFEQAYEKYERMALEGKMHQHKIMPAKQLWRKILSRLFETGHPWITFKDPCNIRSPQDHVGVVHSSNLCTEITLNTSKDETAVCNLGSVNLSEHVKNGVLDDVLLRNTIRSAVRMLDNVIDLNFYPTKEAASSNMRHRPIGLGQMGFQDALFKLNIPFDSDEALEFADIIGEKISYYALEASSDLAEEKGAYSSFKGSKWDRGIFPVDTLDLLERERGIAIDVNRIVRLDWDILKKKIKSSGLRNSNCLSVAPTATIANIAGCFPCIEPAYKNIYVKANVAGEFTIVNKYLIEDLKRLGLWDQKMLELIKYYDGEVSKISSLPESIRKVYRTAFEFDPERLLELTALRGKWIDQSQSHNIFARTLSGKKIQDVYIKAWKLGLKTTYYYRTEGASQVEKSTLDAKEYGFTQKREYDAAIVIKEEVSVSGAVSCSMEESCSSCQ